MRVFSIFLVIFLPFHIISFPSFCLFFSVFHLISYLSIIFSLTPQFMQFRLLNIRFQSNSYLFYFFQFWLPCQRHHSYTKSYSCSFVLDLLRRNVSVRFLSVNSLISSIKLSLMKEFASVRSLARHRSWPDSRATRIYGSKLRRCRQPRRRQRCRRRGSRRRRPQIGEDGDKSNQRRPSRARSRWNYIPPPR